MASGREIPRTVIRDIAGKCLLDSPQELGRAGEPGSVKSFRLQVGRPLSSGDRCLCGGVRGVSTALYSTSILLLVHLVTRGMSQARVTLQMFLRLTFVTQVLPHSYNSNVYVLLEMQLRINGRLHYQ